MQPPTCDMADCAEPVTMIDDKGFGFCTNHGLDRRSWRPCRKLRSHELARILRGETIASY